MDIYNPDEEESTPDLRRAVKTRDFGLIYGLRGEDYIKRITSRNLELGFYYPSPGLANAITLRWEYLTSSSKSWLTESLQKALDYAEARRQFEMREMRAKYTERWQ